MTELTIEERTRLQHQIERLGETACTDLTIMAAQNIVNQMIQRPEVASAVYSMLPANLATQTGPDGKLKLDLDCNGSAMTDELEAAMISAAQIAHRQSIPVSSVTVEQAVSAAPPILELIRREGTGQCRAN